MWKYYYIGLGTVKHKIDRREIWKKEKYKTYRKFFNLLTSSKGRHKELIHPYHDDEVKNRQGKVVELDWERKSRAPYIIFDSSDDKTHFNLVNPLLVAEYRIGNNVWKGNVMETWKLSNASARKVYDLIPKRKGGKKPGKKLRTSHTGFGHSLMNLTNELGRDIRRLKETRKALLKISREIADS